MVRRSGSQRAAVRRLTELYEELSPGAYRFAYHLTRSREDADDLVQVAFLQLFRVLERGDAVLTPAAWLATVIRRRAINLHAQRREEPASDRLEQRFAATDGGSGEAAELLAQIEALLISLPEAQHQAFVLRHWSGLSHKEIAAVLETTDSAVESLLVRARAAVIAGGETAETCAEVCSMLVADRSLPPALQAHLDGCARCGAARRRLARATGAAAAAALVPSLHVNHALAAAIPGFGVGATGGGGAAAATASASGKAGAASLLAKGGIAAVAVTAAALGVHARVLHRAGPVENPRFGPAAVAAAARRNEARPAAGVPGRPSAAGVSEAGAAIHRPVGEHSAGSFGNGDRAGAVDGGSPSGGGDQGSGSSGGDGTSGGAGSDGGTSGGSDGGTTGSSSDGGSTGSSSDGGNSQGAQTAVPDGRDPSTRDGASGGGNDGGGTGSSSGGGDSQGGG